MFKCNGPYHVYSIFTWQKFIDKCLETVIFCFLHSRHNRHMGVTIGHLESLSVPSLSMSSHTCTLFGNLQLLFPLTPPPSQFSMFISFHKFLVFHKPIHVHAFFSTPDWHNGRDGQYLNFPKDYIYSINPHL